MDKGWVKLHRSMLEWEWYDDIPTKTLFLHLILTVNYEDKKWHGELIKRGSKITSLPKLAEETTLSVRQVRTALDKLEKTGEVTRRATNRFTLVTVENYEKFQCYDAESDTQKGRQMTDKRQTDDRQMTSTKEIKNIKNIKNIYIGIPDGLISAISDYKKMRTKMRKPMTERSEQMLLNKLKDMCDINSAEAIAIVEQSIEHNWLSVYPLKDDYTSPTQAAEKQKDTADKLQQLKERLQQLREQQTELTTNFNSNRNKENFDKLTACNTEIGRLEEIISKGEKNES